MFIEKIVHQMPVVVRSIECCVCDFDVHSCQQKLQTLQTFAVRRYTLHVSCISVQVPTPGTFYQKPDN